MWRHLQAVFAAVRTQDVVRVYSQIAKWIHGNEHVTDVGVNLGIREAHLQVAIDGFVRDLRQQCHIRDASLWLLEAFTPIRLGNAAIHHRRWAGCRMFPPARALGDHHDGSSGPWWRKRAGGQGSD